MGQSGYTRIMSDTATQITQDELIDMLKNAARGTNFVHLNTVTEPKLKKTCPHPSVKKHASITLMLGVDYAKRLAKKGEEPARQTPEELEKNWFETFDDQNWLVRKKSDHSKLYLRVSPTQQNSSEYSYTSNNVPVSKDEINPHLYAKSNRDSAPEVFMYAIENIKSITYNGTEYIITR